MIFILIPTVPNNVIFISFPSIMPIDLSTYMYVNCSFLQTQTIHAASSKSSADPMLRVLIKVIKGSVYATMDSMEMRSPDVVCI